MHVYVRLAVRYFQLFAAGHRLIPAVPCYIDPDWPFPSSLPFFMVSFLK